MTTLSCATSRGDFRCWLAIYVRLRTRPVMGVVKPRTRAQEERTQPDVHAQEAAESKPDRKAAESRSGRTSKTVSIRHAR